MTGAELRAWRERLGKDEAWAEDVLGATDVPANEHDDRMPGDGLFGVQRRSATEGNGGAYSARQVDALRTAYRAALEAEEARQAAERGPVEPVCPEGVWLFREGEWTRCYSATDSRGGNIARVSDDGTIALCLIGDSGTPVEHVEYVAALSRYRAALHAASDKQRKLDAVRAAERSVGAAHEQCEAAHAAYRDAEATVGRAVGILNAARREAGL